jgi:hypothetical protein
MPACPALAQEDIKAALINLGSNGHVDPTRRQQDVMLEDSRSMDGPPCSSTRASPYDMAAWAAAAAAQTASAAASRAGMGAADIGSPAFNMRHQWGWGMNSASPFHVNAPPGAWGLLGSDGVGSSAGSDSRGASTSNASSLGGASGINLPALQQWYAMQQGNIARGLTGSSSSSPAAALASGAAGSAAVQQNQASSATTLAGDAKLGQCLPVPFNLAEAMKQGGSASGISDGFPALRNHYMRNAAAADAATRNAGSLQQPALVSDAVLAVAAAAANSPLPMLSSSQGSMGMGDNLLMQQLLAMQNMRNGWDQQQLVAQQQLSPQQQLSQQQHMGQQAAVAKREQATPQQEHEAQHQQPLSQQQKRGRAPEPQSSQGNGSNVHKSQVRVRLFACDGVARRASRCKRPPPHEPPLLPCLPRSARRTRAVALI